MDLTPQPIDWKALLAIAATMLVTFFLLRRLVLGGRHPQDWLMFRRLRNQGFDLAKPHAVGFVTFVDSETRGNELADRFRRDGFECTVACGQIQFQRSKRKPGAPQDGWVITSTRTMPIDMDEIARLREYFTTTAKGEQGLYLGWQVNPLQTARAAD